MTPKQSTSPLAELRKAAGYSSARAFAVEVDIAPSTYARYEQSAENIPTKQLVMLADHLGCTTDEILGRTGITTDVSRGPIQKAYDELTPERQLFIEELIDFARSKDELSQKRREEEEFQRDVRYVRHYEGQLFQEAGSKKELENILVFGTPDEKQAAFLDHVCGLAAEQREKAWHDVSLDFYYKSGDECGFYMRPDENGIQRYAHSYDDDYKEKFEAEEKMRISECLTSCISRDVKTIKAIMDAYRYLHPDVEEEITEDALLERLRKEEAPRLLN